MIVNPPHSYHRHVHRAIQSQVKLRATSRRVPRARSSGKTTEEVAEYEPEPNMKLSRALAVVLLLHVVAIGGVIAFSVIKDHDAIHRTASSSSSTANASEAEDAHLPSTNERDPTDAAARGGVHVVQRGETLTRIANANGVTLAALLAANSSSAVGGIHPGQELKLPEKVSTPVPRPASTSSDAVNLIEQRNAAQDDADLAAVNLTPSTSPTVAPKAPRQTLPPESGQTYVIGKGESPYTIAQKFKVSPNALLKLNGIDDPKKVHPGQKIRIPAKTESAKAATPSKSENSKPGTPAKTDHARPKLKA